MKSIKHPPVSRADIPAPTFRDGALPPEIASLGWSREWTRLLLLALEGNRAARGIWEMLAEAGDVDAHHVITTWRVLEATA